MTERNTEFDLNREQVQVKKRVERALNAAHKQGLRLLVYSGTVFLEPKGFNNQDKSDPIDALEEIDASLNTRIEADGGAGV